MPKGGRRGKGQKKATACSSGDVSLNDYANAVCCPSSNLRVKKGSANAIQAEVRLLTKPEGQQLKEELNWFEKDLDDFDIDPHGNNEQEDEEDVQDLSEGAVLSSGAAASLPVRPRRRKKHSSVSWDVEKKGRVYPVDLWYILSEYIYPEDIGRFAALCHDTYLIVCSCAFWRQLYLRNYDKKIKLPDEIKPQSIERIRGLRARVIRSMYYLYAPLSGRSVSMVPFENEPHSLQGQRCLLAWHQPVKNTWTFCFKFLKLQSTTFRPGPVESSGRDMLPGYSDLFYNPEEGCRIMEIQCQNFASIPMVMGMVLSHVCLTVSARMRHYRLRLLFDSILQQGNQSSAERIVDLDPVVNIRIVPWWDTKYPFTF
ncbi:transmembrane protein 183-like [Gigantopelta aegis]|uniref:transmembrane protein 183-like n=1 Tax=Gigantopelta aegis TaxID=1735272 RepID=UPI001B88A988|nr:transmembrane protein 183-like [Gigantopelta aegis]